MRIIAGTARGKTIATLPGLDTRPTLDKVREAIFGSIQFDITDAAVLDVFAGSGAMGLEALSRGARECVFIEKNPAAMHIIKQNAAAARLVERSVFRQGDFADELMRLDRKFDFVFIDPPYAAGLYNRVFSILDERDILSEDARLFAEHDRPLEINGSFELLRERRYGKTSISVFKRTK